MTTFTNQSKNELQDFLLSENGDVLNSEDGSVILLQSTGTPENQSKNTTTFTNKTKN